MTLLQTIRANNVEVPKYPEDFRQKVINWVLNMQISPNQFKMSDNADSTIFTSCFALFILDLFKETERFTNEQRASWVSYIRGFQSPEHGYFEPEKYYHNDKERNCYQLTCFCLSALGILGAEPQYPLSFLNQWKTPNDIKKYLYEKGCHQGVPGSGNKAMFLAIFLTYEYERTKENHLRDKINAWFEFHSETQNRNGFWGADLKSHYLHGLQNGFHQFVIYFYWRREIPRLNKIIDVALMSQDKQCFFAPTPGGEACHDYDAVHILTMARRMTDYRKDEIELCLSRAFDAILSTRNSEGGFCQSKCRLVGLTDFFRYIPIYFSNSSPYLWYYRTRVSLGIVLRRKNPICTDWTEKPRFRNESSLWDTWFRCLALAEIAHTVDNSMLGNFRNVHFHKTPGLGYFLK